MTKPYPDFDTMTGPQLVEIYNEMILTAIDLSGDAARYRPVTRFADTVAARRRCARLHSTIEALSAGVKAAERQTTEPEATVSAGLARLRAHPDAEDIRQRTLAEQEAAAAAVARSQPQEDGQMTTKTKTKATTKKTPKATTGSRSVDTDQRIVVAALYKETNPKRGNAAKRFEHYCDNMTVADYIAKVKDRGLALADIRWDVKQGFIRLLKPV